MSEEGVIGLENLGQGMLRTAHSLFAPEPLPTRLPALHGLLTDPAERLNALLVPLTPFLHTTAASSPQPPESAVEPRRETSPANQRTRQAGRDADTSEPSGITGWADFMGKTPFDTRAALPTVPDAFSPPAASAALPTARSASPLPRQTDVSRRGNIPHAPETTHSGPRAFPDALDALRTLTTSARASMTLPVTGVNNGSHTAETPTTGGSAVLNPVFNPPAPRSPDSPPFPSVRNGDEAGNDARRDTRLSFLQTRPSPVADGPLSLRLKSARQDGTGQDTGRAGKQLTPPAVTGPTQERNAPLRLMRGASPLAAMLQAHVQTVPLDAAPLPAPSPAPDRPAMKADMPPVAERSVLIASRAAPAVRELALTPQDTPNNVPSPAAPPDMDALIEALEAHLELEFLRAYGTSGR